MKRLLIIAFSILFVALFSFASFEFVFHYKTVLSDDDITISNITASDGILQVTVKVNTIGVYAYSMTSKVNGEDLIIDFWGGKQPSLSAGKNNEKPAFGLAIPKGIKNIVYNDDVVLVVSE